ncbi:hypothetical protein GCM10023149_30740 [Mucilaginibacter gynuensis]|uniref:Uncharacterized protein n=1 Tax=Mucilaginibacter gynuensis TaxID=1302236 RepID=A0ABP8GNP1_9SPHI
MPVTLNQAPPKLAFSRNHLLVKLQSDDFRDTYGSPAANYLRFNSAIAAGVVFSLNWSGANVIFTAATSPTGSNQFPTGDGGAAYVQSLIPYVLANYYVRRDFTVSYSLYLGQHTLVFTAKEYGTKYNIATFTASSIALNRTNGVDEVLKPNFAHPLQVWLKDVGEVNIYERNLNLDFPLTGITTKDISDILHTYLDYDIPALNTAWQACPNSVKNYFLVYGQYYGDTPDFKRMYQSDTYTISLGGYSNKALSRISDANHFQNYLLPAPELYKQQRWFETFPIDNVEVKTNQQQFLYFMNMRDAAETLAIKVGLIFSDGTTQDITIAGGLVLPRQKVCIGCGYQQLGLTAYNSIEKPVTAYVVQLVEIISGESRSKTKTFNVNRTYEPFTRYIIYSDSAGNFKTLRAYGKSQVTAEVESSEAERYDSIDTPKQGNITRYDVRITESDELNSGYLSGNLDDLQDLLLARYAFRVFGETLVPIIINNKKAALKADAQNLTALKIEYSLAFHEKNYTGSTGELVVPQLNQPQQAINDI